MPEPGENLTAPVDTTPSCDREPAGSGVVAGEIILRIAEVAILSGGVILLPLLGVQCAGNDPADYLNFPPQMGKVSHFGFSWLAFAAVVCLAVLLILPFALRFLNYRYRPDMDSRRESAPGINGLDARYTSGCFSSWVNPPAAGRRRFPLWGWSGFVLGAVAWTLAWTRFGWFAGWQRHTFTPLWLAYIVVVNAATYRRSGHCMLKDRPVYFASLFPLSAVFWWGFEYLNRFVENWHYHGHGATNAAEYLLLGSLAFSTVLPAVLSTRDFLATYPRLTVPFRQFIPLPEAHSRALAGGTFFVAATGLVCVGLIPNVSYPLLWLAPLMLLLSMRVIRGGKSIISPIIEGDWREVVVLALAALICGFFWEMWNFRSLAKWTYSVPLLQRFHLFEMPILGYLGYLPFGILCAAVAELVLGPHRKPVWRVDPEDSPDSPNQHTHRSPRHPAPARLQDSPDAH